jgi:hypothetical protein
VVEAAARITHSRSADTETDDDVTRSGATGVRAHFGDFPKILWNTMKMQQPQAAFSWGSLCVFKDGEEEGSREKQEQEGAGHSRHAHDA